MPTLSTNTVHRTRHQFDDRECLIFVSGKKLSFDSLDSAIDALASDGILRTDDGKQPEFQVSGMAIEDWP